MATLFIIGPLIFTATLLWPEQISYLKNPLKATKHLESATFVEFFLSKTKMSL